MRRRPFEDEVMLRLDTLLDRSEKIFEALETLVWIGECQMQSWEELKAEVAKNTSVDESVLALIDGFNAKLDEWATREFIDPVEVKAEADKLRAANEKLAAAVSANTPAEEDSELPPVEEAPVEEPVEGAPV